MRRRADECSMDDSCEFVLSNTATLVSRTQWKLNGYFIQSYLFKQQLCEHSLHALHPHNSTNGRKEIIKKLMLIKNPRCNNPPSSLS
jgi:hypothetical protein